MRRKARSEADMRHKTKNGAASLESRAGNRCRRDTPYSAAGVLSAAAAAAAFSAAMRSLRETAIAVDTLGDTR